MRHYSFTARVSLVAMASLVLGCVSLYARSFDTSQSYTAQVDYAQSINDSLNAGGYNWVDSQVNDADFPDSTTGSASLTAVLVPYDTSMSIDDLTKTQAAAGYRPATLKELLAFGKANPDLQKDAPIIALGTSADVPETVFRSGLAMNAASDSAAPVRINERLYPYLGDGIFGRTVNLAWPGDFESLTSFYALMIKK